MEDPCTRAHSLRWFFALFRNLGKRKTIFPHHIGLLDGCTYWPGLASHATNHRPFDPYAFNIPSRKWFQASSFTKWCNMLSLPYEICPYMHICQHVTPRIIFSWCANTVNRSATHIRVDILIWINNLWLETFRCRWTWRRLSIPSAVKWWFVPCKPYPYRNLLSAWFNLGLHLSRLSQFTKMSPNTFSLGLGHIASWFHCASICGGIIKVDDAPFPVICASLLT